MHKNVLRTSLLALTLSLSGAAFAQSATDFFSDVGINAKIGTGGLGIDISKSITDNTKVRVGFGSYTYSDDYDEDQVSYDADLRLGGWSLLADYHPFSNGWRLTAGAYGPKHKLSGTGRFSGAGEVTINDTVYTNADLNGLDVAAKWDGVRPYLGLGYDSMPTGSKGGMFFSADLGVIFAGSPDVSLTANCINPGLCASLASDVEAERRKIEDDLDDAKYLPVLQVGVGYRF